MIQYNVYLYNDFIGFFYKLNNEKIAFEFTSDYHEMLPRPILGQYFEDNLDAVYKSSKRRYLPNFFDNLLPEGALKDKLISIHNLNEYEPLEILSILGDDLPGAVTVKTEQTQSVYKEKKDFPPFLEVEENHLKSLSTDGLRFSLAGVQLKFSLVQKETTWTLPMKGDSGQWIIKLAHPEHYSNVVENEFITMTWAKQSGLNVPDFKLIRYGNIESLPVDFLDESSTIFSIKRYDRINERRLHQEDFAQVTNLAAKNKYDYKSYEDLAKLSYFILGEEGLIEYIKRLIFVFVSGNFDAHLKNWSLLYIQNNSQEIFEPCWSPVYDQVSTVMWPDLLTELALTFMKTRQLYTISHETMKTFYRKLISEVSEISSIKLTADELMEIHDQIIVKIKSEWSELKLLNEFSAQYEKSIIEHWSKVPFLKRYGNI